MTVNERDLFKGDFETLWNHALIPVEWRKTLEYMNKGNARRNHATILNEWNRLTSRPDGLTNDEVIAFNNQQLKYAIPGGQIDEGETAEQAARREFEEETKILRASLGDLIKFPGSKNASFFTTELNIREDFGTIEGSTETVEWRWIPLDQVRQSLVINPQTERITIAESDALDRLQRHLDSIAPNPDVDELIEANPDASQLVVATQDADGLAEARPDVGGPVAPERDVDGLVKEFNNL